MKTNQVKKSKIGKKMMFLGPIALTSVLTMVAASCQKQEEAKPTPEPVVPVTPVVQPLTPVEDKKEDTTALTTSEGFENATSYLTLTSDSVIQTIETAVSENAKTESKRKPYSFVYDRNNKQIVVFKGPINWTDGEKTALYNVDASFLGNKQIVNLNKPTYQKNGRNNLSSTVDLSIKDGILTITFKLATYDRSGNHQIDEIKYEAKFKLTKDSQQNKETPKNTEEPKNVDETNDKPKLVTSEGFSDASEKFTLTNTSVIDQIKEAVEANKASTETRKPYSFVYDRNNKQLVLFKGAINWKTGNRTALYNIDPSFLGSKQLVNLNKSTYEKNEKINLNATLDVDIQDSNIFIVTFKLAKYDRSGNHQIDDVKYEAKLLLDKSNAKSSSSNSSSVEPTSPTNGNTNYQSGSIALDKYLYDASNNYYASLVGKRGEELFKALQRLQAGKTNQIRSYNDLYKVYKIAFIDKELENDGTILDIYSENPNGKDPYNFLPNEYEGTGGHNTGMRLKDGEAETFNREHIVPQSWFNKANPTRNDPHFIWPTDKIVNNRRGNLPHFTVSNPEWTSLNGTKVGGGNAEPIDFFKGDVARAYFYFQATHHNALSKGGSQVFESAFPYFNQRYLNEYMKWAHQDSVDLIEIHRNNAIAQQYDKFDGLRNPFIDYPDLVDLIWGSGDKVFENRGILIGIKQ
ncbi:endonuclease [Mycoplasmopsis columbina]|uniref:endonuclease n=1 Tax=Mycoplasmopsis columbina TaxID=114881 RepID=UPI00068C3416|nr:endonuclease [Mycoplasmopsis columbina]VEU76888.1 Extracellular ribonuclease precursor [Mycoplasmopsis columbina]